MATMRGISVAARHERTSRQRRPRRVARCARRRSCWRSASWSISPIALPGQAMLLPAWPRPAAARGSAVLGQWLPSFLHPFAFSLLTVAALGPSRARATAPAPPGARSMRRSSSASIRALAAWLDAALRRKRPAPGLEPTPRRLLPARPLRCRRPRRPAARQPRRRRCPLHPAKNETPIMRIDPPRRLATLRALLVACVSFARHGRDRRQHRRQPGLSALRRRHDLRRGHAAAGPHRSVDPPYLTALVGSPASFAVVDRRT